MSISGLQTTANVTIKVGVQRQTSFNQFEQKLNAIKTALNEVSKGTGGVGTGAAVTAARVQGQRLADVAKREAIRTAAAVARINQTARAKEVNKAAAAVVATARKQSQAEAKQRKAGYDATMKFLAQNRQAWNKSIANISSAQTKAQKADQAKFLAGVALKKRADADLLRTQLANAKVLQRDRNQKAALEARNWQRQFNTAVKNSTVLAARTAAIATGGYAGTGDQMVAFYRNTEANKQSRANILNRATNAPPGVDAKRYLQAANAVRAYVTELNPAQAKISDYAKAWSRLNAVEAENIAHSDKMRKSMSYRLDQVEKQMDAIFRAAFRLQMVGQQMQMFGRRIRDTLTGIMDTFGEFQFMLNRAGATLEVFNQHGDSTRIGLLDLQEGILQLSRDSKLLPAQDVAEAMYHWAAATGQVVKTNEDLEANITALEPIMHAALLTNTGYETTIKGVYGIISQFYNGAIDKATFVTEQLYYMTQKTAVEFQDLINAFKMVGPVARANNVTFEEMNTLFGQLGDLGIKGTMAGRALRQLFIQSSKPSKPARDIYEDMFGKGWNQVMNPGGRFVGVIRWVNKIAQATLDWSEADRNHAIAQITTANELPVMTALVIKQQRQILHLDDALDKYTSTSEKAHQYFEQSWTTLSKTWNAVSGSLARAWEHLQIQLGSSLMDVFNPLVTRMAEIVEGIRLWARANPELIRGIGQIVAVVAGLTSAGGVLLSIAGGILALGTAIVLIFTTIQPWIVPISAAFAMIAGIVVAIVRNVDYISERFKEASDIISSSMKNSAGEIRSFGDVFTASMGVVNEIFTVVVRSLADVIPLIAKFIAVILDINKVLPILETLKAIIVTMFAYKTLQFIKGFILQIGVLNTVLTSMGRAGGVGGFIGPVKPVNAMARSMLNLRGAATSLYASIGPIGIALAAISIGFALYETDFMGFGKFIDSITDRFRNLGKEIDDLKGQFSEGTRLESSITKFLSNIVDVEGAIRTASKQEDGSLITEIYGGQLTVTAANEEQLRTILQGTSDRLNIMIFEEIDKARGNLNMQLAKENKDVISADDFASAFINFAISPNAIRPEAFNKSTSSAIVESILREVSDTGFGPESKARILKMIKDTWPGWTEATDIFVEGFEEGWNKTFGGTKFIDQIIHDQQTKQNTLFQPLFDSLNAALDKAVRDESGQITDQRTIVAINDLMLNPFRDAAGKMHESMAAYVQEHNASPLVKEVYERFNSEIGSAAEDLTPIETGRELRDSWLKQFMEGVTSVSGVRETIKNAAKAGTDKKQLLKAISDTFSVKGKDAKDFFKGFLGVKGNTALRSAIEDSTTEIQGSIDDFRQRHPHASRRKFREFLRSQIPTIGELGRLGFSRSQIRTIRRNVRRSIQPIIDALRNSMNTVTGGKEPDSSGLVRPEQYMTAGVPKSPLQTQAEATANAIVTSSGTASTAVTTMATSVHTALDPLPADLGAIASDAMLQFNTGLSGGPEGKGISTESIIGRMAAFSDRMVAAIDVTKAYSIGSSWATEFNRGMADEITSGLSFVGTITIGNSPPKVGPLKDIDKGGYNVGKAWGSALGRGAAHETAKSLHRARRHLGMDDDVHYRSQHERVLKIDVNVRSTDGTANKLTQGQIREAAIKSLSLDAVAHLAQIG